MKRAFLFFGGLLLTLQLGTVPGLTQAASELNQADEDQNNDLFTNREGTAVNNMMDMIHRVNFGTIRSPEQFNQEQGENINSAAEAFRQRQRERMEQQPPAPGAEPQPAPLN